MISGFQLEKKIEKGNLENYYIFCGIDENLIKESIDKIINKALNNNFIDLNLNSFDGEKTEVEKIVNACETIPFMDDKKVVVVYNANFFEDKTDKALENKYKDLLKYMENLPQHVILIFYYLFKTDRDKPSNKIKRIKNGEKVVHIEKLKGDALQKRVKELFEIEGKNINKSELLLFCSLVEGNLEAIKNEVNKLCFYTYGREIEIEDINKTTPPKRDNDIFNLVDFLSMKKAEKAILILNELVYKGEKIPMILYMIERQFKLLYNIKIWVERGKSKEEIVKEYNLNPYICEKMIIQSRKFKIEQLKKSLMLCLETEKRIKSSYVNPKAEMEYLIINAIRS